MLDLIETSVHPIIVVYCTASIGGRGCMQSSKQMCLQLAS